MGRLLQDLLRFAMEAIWTLWLGGLTFYIAIVVPVGATVVGSNTQGEITSLVTFYLNGLALLATISCMPIKLWSGRRLAPKWTTLAMGLCTGIAMVAVVQIWLRLMLLDRMQHGEPTSVGGAVHAWSFYTLHRLYLWLTTIQWGCGVMMHWIRHRSGRGSLLAGDDWKGTSLAEQFKNDGHIG